MIRSKAKAVVTSLAKVSRPNENGHRDCAAPIGGEKENLIPPMLLAGLISTASMSSKSEGTLAHTRGSKGLYDYKPSRTNMSRMKLEGKLDVVEYSRITIPDD